ncbi:hypothetical protein HZC31_03535 [Candidatus Woesearchaeota archaeon]|nr:hypothetical protein [Candidatus Woesearchaeota archaeon]
MNFVEQKIERIKKITKKPDLIDNVVAILSLVIGLFISAELMAWMINSLFQLPDSERELTLKMGTFVILVLAASLYCGYYVYGKTKNTKSPYYYWSTYNIIIGWYWVFLFLLTIAYPGLDLFGDDQGLIILASIFDILYAISFFIIARYALRRYKFPHPNTFLKWTGFAFISASSFYGLTFLISELDYALIPDSLKDSYIQLPYYSILKIFFYISLFISLLSAAAFILLLLFTILYAGYEIAKVKEK